MVVINYKIFFLIYYTSILIESSVSENGKNFDLRYTIKGTLYLPYSDIIEPFQLWYDKIGNRSRIDYYNGMVKTYQYENYENHGILLKIVPYRTDKNLNSETCFIMRGNKNQKIRTQTVIPDLEKFKYIGNDILLGIKCKKYELKENFNDRENIYKFWIKIIESDRVTINKSSSTTTIVYDIIPVRYEMRGYNTIMGSHYDHYYIDYESYEYDIDNLTEIFKYENIKNLTNLNCINKIKKVVNSISMNPIQEFIYPIQNSDHIDEKFNLFMNQHQFKYSNNSEIEYRKNVFRQNLRFIESNNRKNHHYKLKVNHLADKTDEEISMLLGYRPTKDDYEIDDNLDNFEIFLNQLNETKVMIPDNFDWRFYGAVTSVKDQSACGSCWSFATTGVVEGAYFLKTGKLIRFSEQALIDCSWDEKNFGCDGGTDIRSYKWIQNINGLPIDKEYGPYLAQDGYCHINRTNLFAKIIKYYRLPSNNENLMKIALLKNGPLYIAVNASPKTFHFYSHGIYYDKNCANQLKNLNHAMLLVGYGILNNQSYWLVKNSWSTRWGIDGYLLIAVDDNNCGVMTKASYIVM